MVAGNLSIKEKRTVHWFAVVVKTCGFSTLISIRIFLTTDKNTTPFNSEPLWLIQSQKTLVNFVFSILQKIDHQCGTHSETLYSAVVVELLLSDFGFRGCGIKTDLFLVIVAAPRVLDA